MKDSEMKLSTALLHGGFRADAATGAVDVPIYQSAAFAFESASKAADLFSLKDSNGYIYSRMNNPTVDVLEQRLALLEGGSAALCVASGQAAALYAVGNLAQAGDNIVASPAVYGGIFSLFANMLKRFQITVRFANPDDPDSFAALTDDKTRAYYAETLPNPGLRVFPIEEVAAVAHQHRLPLIIDNTCAPTLCHPFTHGADIVVYSTTKYIGGQGVAIGGCLIDSGRFDWTSSAQPLMNTPDPAYNGIVWSEFAATAFCLKARATLLRDLGAAASPHDAFLFLQGIETLPLRMEKHCQNAATLATFLHQHPHVEKVIYPALASGRDKQRAEKYLPQGKGGMMGVHIHGGQAAAQRFTDALQLFCHAASLGDTRSLAIHPASTTHSQLTAQQQQAVGITDNYVRLSVGIEDVEDLRADLHQALTAQGD